MLNVECPLPVDGVRAFIQHLTFNIQHSGPWLATRRGVLVDLERPVPYILLLMKIVIAGGTGFIGGALVETLARDHEVAVLSRNPSKVRKGRGIQWDAVSDGPWQREVADADAIINLAGENVGGGRWTAARKKKILDSRINATSAIVRALLESDRKDHTLVNASAIGYYGSRGDEILTERAHAGSGFLADVVTQWEAAANEAEDAVRLVIPRFGIVLGDGGALEKMMIPFRMFAGGPTGNGLQWMSWVTREDIIRLIQWAIATPGASGVYNASAPEPVRNREFASTLGEVMKRPSFLPAPAPALRLALGEMGQALLLDSQRVVPERTMAEGFEFRDTSLRPALEKIVR